MSFPTFSYQTIANTVNAWINSNCQNITGTLPNRVKQGQQYICRFAGTDSGSVGSRWRYTVSSPNITSILHINALANPATTSDGGFGQFLYGNGVSNLALNVPQAEFLDLLINVGRFCSAKLRFVGTFSSEPTTTALTTQLNHGQTTYLIYYAAGTPSNVQDMSSLLPYKLIQAEDINLILDTVYHYIVNSVRSMTAQYTIALYST